MKVVLDANVFISSVLTKSGNSHTIVEACKKGDINLVLSKPLLDEIGRVLHKPKLKRYHRWDDTLISRYLSRLVGFTEVVLVTKIPKLEADPTDAIILATAKASQAEMIISGD